MVLGGNLFQSIVCHLWLINNGSCTQRLPVNNELLAVWVTVKRIKVF